MEVWKPNGKKYTTEQYVHDRIRYYWERKRTFEATERSFKDDKYEFNMDMDRYFDAAADEEGRVIVSTKETVKGITSLVCQRITHFVIEFDVDKLKKVLTKAQAKRAIKKSYSVKDWPGLLNLMKESGVGYSEFTKYVDVTETANSGILEQFAELGEIDEEAVKACSNARIKTQYYKVSERNSQIRLRNT